MLVLMLMSQCKPAFSQHMKSCFWMRRQCEIPSCLMQDFLFSEKLQKMKTGTCQNYSRTWQCDWANLNQKVASCFKETVKWSILGYCRVAIKKNIWFDCNGLEGVRNPFPELRLNWQYIIKGFCRTWIDWVFFILYLSFCIYVKTSVLVSGMQWRNASQVAWHRPGFLTVEVHLFRRNHSSLVINRQIQ